MTSLVRRLLPGFFAIMLSIPAVTSSAQWAACSSGSVTCTTQLVGIGTTTTTSGVPVQIVSNNGEVLTLKRTGAYWNYISTYRDTTRAGYVGDLITGWGMGADTLPLVFMTNGIYERMRITAAGTIGIGTTAPVHTFDVWGQSNANGASRELFGIYDTNAAAAGIGGSVVFGGKYNAAGSMAQQFASISGVKENSTDGDYASAMLFYTRVNGGNPAERMRVTSTGFLGIGNAAPAALLTVGETGGTGLTAVVNGDASVIGNMTVSGNLAAKYQDVAEWVPAKEAMTPGTVVVLNTDATNEVMPSQHAYDTSVAGVVTARPGLILGEGGATRAQIATTGRVRVRVDATHAPVHVGDLLVTSDKPGFAMVSQPVNVAGVRMHRPGTLIGKALEPLKEGEGAILVLLSLQ